MDINLKKKGKKDEKKDWTWSEEDGDGERGGGSGEECGGVLTVSFCDRPGI